MARVPVHFGVRVVAGDPADGHRRLVLLRHDHEVAKPRIQRELPELRRVFRDRSRIGIQVHRCDLLPHVVLALASGEVSDLLKAQERHAPVQPGTFVFPVLARAEKPHVARTAPGNQLSQLL